MSYLDEIKSVTVRVGNGSGVIVKPLADDRFYILTAYHVVKEKEKEIDQITLGFQSSSPLCNKKVKIQKVFSSEELDAAILIIQRCGEEIVSFCPCLYTQGIPRYWHAGYPISQNDTENTRSCELHDIETWMGSYDSDGNFVKYRYPHHIIKSELDGMSGGGIFDNKYHLLGVHKQLAVNEETEQLGKNVMIPWTCFEQLIKENGLSPVARFDLSTFETFKNEIFSFYGNRGAEEKLKVLLLTMAQHRKEIVGISPLKYYNDFQESRKVKGYKHGCDLQKNEWVKFGEFLVAIKAVWGLDMINNLDEVFLKFQYVHSENDFDIYEVAQQLDPKLLGKVSNANVVFVVGGIQSKGYKQDVRHKDILDITKASKFSTEFDITSTGREILGAFTFVNAHFFKDAMEANTDEIRDYIGDKLEFYKDLITSKI